VINPVPSQQFLWSGDCFLATWPACLLISLSPMDVLSIFLFAGGVVPFFSRCGGAPLGTEFSFAIILELRPPAVLSYRMTSILCSLFFYVRPRSLPTDLQPVYWQRGGGVFPLTPTFAPSDTLVLRCLAYVRAYNPPPSLRPLNPWFCFPRDCLSFLVLTYPASGPVFWA